MGLLDRFDPGALSLLAAAGPTSQPMSLGQRLFGALQQTQAMKQAEEDRKLKQQMQAMQMLQLQNAMDQSKRQQAEAEAMKQKRASFLDSIDPSRGPAMPMSVPNALNAGISAAELALLSPKRADSPYAKINPSDYTPESLAKFGVSGNVADLKKYVAPEKPDLGTTDMRNFDAVQKNPAFREFLREQANLKAPRTTVSLGSPVPITMPDGTVGLVQPANKPGEQPQILRLPDGSLARPQKDPPAALTDKMATNAVTLQKIDRALALVAKNPNSLGAQNYLGDAVMQRLDPGGVEVRAMVADIGGQKIHDRSGAAVTVGESERLKPYIPAATDSPEVVKTKLTMFRNEYAAMQQALASGASIHQASRIKGPQGTQEDPLGIRGK